MIFIKNQPPDFFDAICGKCGCKFFYQLEDVIFPEKLEAKDIEDLDFSSEDLTKKLLGNIFQEKNPHTNCPCCKNVVYHNACVYGFGGK